jgi:Na+-translocating ferredoxin:NAD+ oxidoreductase subunit G
MKEFVRLVVTPTVICLLAGVLLAAVNKVTEEPIARAKQAEKSEAMKQVLPDCDNEPMGDTVVVTEDGAQWTFYVARSGGTFVGAACISTTSEGYGGDISIMVGINADDEVQAIAILDQKETPGLGANIKSDGFRACFNCRSAEETNWSVKKDGGDIDEITAATISSRAVVGAVKSGLDVYLKHKDRIQSAPAQPGVERARDA